MKLLNKISTQDKGFTFIEFVLTLGISLILIMLPFSVYRYCIANNIQQVALDQLGLAIRFARHEAIALDEPVILCGSSDQQHCDGQWSAYQLVKTEQKILRVFSTVPSSQHLTWQNKISRYEVLIFGATGLLEGQQGSFTLCSESKKDGKMMTITHSGRIRIFEREEC